jgi:hypothetical protein
MFWKKKLFGVFKFFFNFQLCNLISYFLYGVANLATEFLTNPSIYEVTRIPLFRTRVDRIWYTNWSRRQTKVNEQKCVNMNGFPILLKAVRRNKSPGLLPTQDDLMCIISENIHNKWLKIKLSHHTPWRRLGREEYSSYSFSNSSLDGGVFSVTPRPHFNPGGKDPPVPTVQEAGWAPGPVWTQRLEEKSFRLYRGSTTVDRSRIIMKQQVTWPRHLKAMYVVHTLAFRNYKNQSRLVYVAQCMYFS